MPVTPQAEVGLMSYADMARMEQVLRHSDADWTIVRPPRLTDGSLTGRYRTAVNHHLRVGRAISRGDLATAILDLLENPDTVRATVAVAY